MKQLKITVLAMVVVCVASVALACSVPVFRYALERWANDPYEVVVFYQGKLTAEQKLLVSDLSLDGAAGKQHANVRLSLVDISDTESEDPKHSELLKQWEEQKNDVLPAMMVKYPAIAHQEENVWVGQLTKQNITYLLDSPSRREIARRLLKGETAVWVLLESGKKEKDEAALKKLQTHLLLAEKELKLPEIEQADIEQGLVSVDEKGLMLKFSTIRLSRKDPLEKMFVEMLLGSEDDLRDFDEPMAFPIFGRGRVMYALIDKGINADTVRQSCHELIGPCTCEVKEENPGIDLITSVDWENLVQQTDEIDRELPPLPGFGGIVNADDPNEKNAPQKEASEGTNVLVAGNKISENNGDAPADKTTTAGMNPVIRNVLFLSGAGVVIVLLLSFFMMSRGKN